MNNHTISINQLSVTSKRIHCIDNARGIASVLGLVFHTTLIFSAPWIINAEVLSDKFIFILYKDYLNLFRMPLFWLVSGHFSMVSMRKMSALQFVKNRLMRLGLPMLTTMVFLGMLPTFILQITDFHDPDLKIGTLNPFDKLFFASHIWFLNYAMLFSLTALILYWFIFKRQPEMARKLKSFMRATPHPLLWILVSSTLGYLLLSLISIHIPSPAASSLFKVYANNAIYFAVGIIVGIDYPNISQKVLLVSWRYFLQGLLLAAVLLYLRHQLALTIILSDLCLILARLSLLYVAMFLIYRYLNRTNRFLKYLADASYPVYLLHQPAIAVTATIYFSIERGVIFMGNPYLDFSIILVFATLLTYLLEFVLVRKCRITSFLLTGNRKKNKKSAHLQTTA